VAGYPGFRETFGIVFSPGEYLAFAAVGMLVAVMFLAGDRMTRRGLRSLDYASKAAVVALAALSALTWAASLKGTSPEPKEMAEGAPRPNILLIVLDTVRGDHLSCYGYHRNTTPVIDRFASGGVLFERVMSVSHWTLPSHASMFTGQFPGEHLATGEHLFLEANYPTMAQLLYRLGYQTAGFSANPAVSGVFGLDRGFEHFEVRGREGKSDRFKLVWKRWWRYIVEVNRRAVGIGWLLKSPEEDYKGRFPPASLMMEKLKKWWKTSRDENRPFFVFINLMDAHMPYDEPVHTRLDDFFDGAGEYRLAFKVNQNQWKYYSGDVKMTAADFDLLKKLYDGQINYMDAQLGRLFALLKKNGGWKDTVVIITSDHGEYFGERDLMEHLYPCGYPTLDIPLVIQGLPRHESGKRVKALVQNIDLLPTLRDMLKVKWPGSKELPGRSLLDPEPGRNGLAESYPHTELINFLRKYSEEAADKFNCKTQVVWSGGYEYIWTGSGGRELYYLPDDATEENNLAGKFPELAGRLNELAATRAARSTGSPAGASERKMEASKKETLKALGYVR